MIIEAPTKACGISFNTALGYPQVSVVYEADTKRYLRRYSLSCISRIQQPSVLTYQDFFCENYHHQVPRSVCHILDLEAIDAIENLYDQIRHPIHAYLENPCAESERELCTAIELAGL